MALPLGELSPKVTERGGVPPRAMRYALHPTNGCPSPLDPGLRTAFFVGDDVESSYEPGEPIGVSTPAGLSGSHCQRRHAAPLRRLIAASSPRGGAKGAAAPVRNVWLGRCRAGGFIDTLKAPRVGRLVF